MTDTKKDLIQRLRNLSAEMRSLGVDLEQFYAGEPPATHGRNLIYSAVLESAWADAMEKDA